MKPDLFATKYEVVTNTDKFDKLWNIITNKSSEQNCQRISKAYLSELPGIEMMIYNYVKLIIETGKVDQDILHVSEKLFQKLWKNYYDSINIKERKNLKVHMQFLPKRFWKYLPEKDFQNNFSKRAIIK